MIKEYNKNIVKCHNCSTLWTFSDEDVEEVGTSNQLGDNYKEHFIKCPKCKNHLVLYNHKGVELSEATHGKELLYVAQKTAERTKKELKIKAREWLEENKYSYIIDIEGETIVDDAIIKDLLKALEE